MSIAKAAAAFAETAFDPKATASQRSRARAALAALGAVETPAPRVARVVAPPPTNGEIALKALSEHPEVRRLFIAAAQSAASRERMTPSERAIIEKLEIKDSKTKKTASAGHYFETPFMTPAEARAFLEEK